MIKKFGKLFLALSILVNSFTFVNSYPAHAATITSVITVPYNPADTTIPHPAYNGHPTTFKAVCRGSDITPTTNIYYRWDVDGDGVWDTQPGRSRPPEIPLGNWYASKALELDLQCNLPYVDPSISHRKLFMAKIEVASVVGSNGIESGNILFGSYPVMVYADIPAVDYSQPTPTQIDNATNEQLTVMRNVAVDDALWYLHKQLTRTGAGTATISGYVSGGLAKTALFALAMEENGHFGAYPPGTYNPYGQQLPPDFNQKNDYRFNQDPYAEDVMRCLNYLINGYTNVSITNAADEADDGKVPIAGTNDLLGYSNNQNFNSELGEQGLALATVAKSRLAGTVAQLGIAQGHSIEYVVQQIVDYAAYAQIDENSDPKAIGGWYYWPCNNTAWGPQYGASTNSNSWYYGLFNAEKEMAGNGVYVNNRVKSRLPNMLYYSQAPDGACYLYNDGTYPVFEPVGLTMLACRWLEWDQWDPNDTTSAGYPYLNITKGQARRSYDRYFSYITSHWNSAGSGEYYYYDPALALWKSGNYASAAYLSVWQAAEGADSNLWTQSLFSLAAVCSQTPNIATFVSHNQHHDFDIGLIKGQCKTGSYTEANGKTFANVLELGSPGATAFAILAGCAGEELRPVAVINASPRFATAQVNIAFDASGSFHFNPNRTILSYNWNFGDGATGSGVSTTHKYTNPGSYTATLTVIDNNNPPMENSDSIIITITPMPNMPPTDISLSNGSVAENSPVNTVVGTFRTSDSNVGDTFTYTLVAGAGSVDNSSFTTIGNQLITNAVFDYETKNSYSIRVRSTDAGGLWCEKVFTISVNLLGPAISSFTPAIGGPGTSVIITGANLSGATAVSFGGTAASFTVNSASQITATVGSGSTGKVSVTTLGGTATSSNTFTFNRPPVADNETYSTNRGTILSVPAPGVLANDRDPDGKPLTAILVSDVSHGKLVLNVDGSFLYSPISMFIGWPGDSFTYKANDGQSDSNVATVNITKTPVLQIIGQSPINILATDPNGLRVGYDPVLGPLNEIPRAIYSGQGTEPQEILIPNPVSGAYMIDTFGTGTGSFTIAFKSFSLDGLLVDGETWTGTTKPGEQYSTGIQYGIDGMLNQPIPATLDFDPNTLNLNTKGNSVTAYIELPKGYDVGNIVVSTVKLNGAVPALVKPIEIGDYDKDNVPDLMVKFDRGAVQNTLKAGDKVKITIIGTVSGIIFAGEDYIKVIK
jgi:hypothetical protein